MTDYTKDYKSRKSHNRRILLFPPISLSTYLSGPLKSLFLHNSLNDYAKGEVHYMRNSLFSGIRFHSDTFVFSSIRVALDIKSALDDRMTSCSGKVLLLVDPHPPPLPQSHENTILPVHHIEIRLHLNII